MLNEQEIINNYDEFIKLIEDSFEGDRKEKLLNLYTNEPFKDRLLFAPASSREYYHGCFPGGYTIHILNVINTAKKLDELWLSLGATKNYTDEELVFSALNHDLGKLGDKNEPYYITHDQMWKKQRGELYELNPKLDYMSVEDRSLFLLQQYKIEYSINEFLAIKLHDGLYEDSNKSYLIAWNDSKKLKTNLPVLLHHADMTATMIEYNEWKNKSIPANVKSQIAKTNKSKSKLKNIDKSLVDSFFGKEEN